MGVMTPGPVLVTPSGQPPGPQVVDVVLDPCRVFPTASLPGVQKIH